MEDASTLKLPVISPPMETPLAEPPAEETLPSTRKNTSQLILFEKVSESVKSYEIGNSPPVPDAVPCVVMFIAKNPEDDEVVEAVPYNLMPSTPSDPSASWVTEHGVNWKMPLPEGIPTQLEGVKTKSA